MFLISNKLEELEFKLQKIVGFRNMQEKLEKVHNENMKTKPQKDDTLAKSQKISLQPWLPKWPKNIISYRQKPSNTGLSI